MFDYKKLENACEKAFGGVDYHQPFLPINHGKRLPLNYFPEEFQGIIPHPKSLADEVNTPSSFDFELMLIKRTLDTEPEAHDLEGEVYFILGPEEGTEVLIEDTTHKLNPGDMCFVFPKKEHLAQTGAEYLLYKYYPKE